MIAHLHGTLRTKRPDRVVVEVGGVGYLVHIPFSTLYELGDEGSAVALFIHTHVRDDALSLFGFSTELEKDVFEELIAVTGIGPRLATTILSGMSAQELLHAIRNEERHKLINIPGLGKKTVERILLELKEKLQKKDFEGIAEKTPRMELAEEVISALQNLGFKKSAAEATAEKVLSGMVGGGPTFEEALKRALKILTG